MPDDFTIDTLDPEEYNKRMQEAFDLLNMLYRDHMLPDVYFPLVKDNPRNIEHLLNALQMYINWAHHFYINDANNYVLATMYATQAAFYLGYKEGMLHFEHEPYRRLLKDIE